MGASAPISFYSDKPARNGRIERFVRALHQRAGSLSGSDRGSNQRCTRAVPCSHRALVRRVQRWMKVRLPVGQQVDIDSAFLILIEVRTTNLNLLPASICVLHLKRSASSRLNPVMKFFSHCDGIRSKTRAGIVNFQQRYRSARIIFDRCFDMVRVACNQCGSACRENK